MKLVRVEDTPASRTLAQLEGHLDRGCPPELLAHLRTVPGGETYKTCITCGRVFVYVFEESDSP